MERQDRQKSHQIKRVLLPSGKMIEVVLYGDVMDQAPDNTRASAGTGAPASESETDLHCCRSCDSELVYPTGWEETGGDLWRVSLRCPECESVREGVFPQDTVDAFDEALEEGADALIADYRQLTRANMAEEIDSFTQALVADAILPEDF